MTNNLPVADHRKVQSEKRDKSISQTQALNQFRTIPNSGA